MMRLLFCRNGFQDFIIIEYIHAIFLDDEYQRKIVLIDISKSTALN